MGVKGCVICSDTIDGRLVEKIERLYSCNSCKTKMCEEHFGNGTCTECNPYSNRHCSECLQVCEMCGEGFCKGCSIVKYTEKNHMVVCEECEMSL